MQTFFIFSKDKTLFKASDNGFCVFSLIFGTFWGMYMGLWEASIFNLLLLSFFGYFAENSLIVFILISNFFWGFFGKDLYIQKLLSKDYLPRRALNAPTREKALIIYLAENKNEISFNN